MYLFYYYIENFQSRQFKINSAYASIDKKTEFKLRHKWKVDCRNFVKYLDNNDLCILFMKK